MTDDTPRPADPLTVGGEVILVQLPGMSRTEPLTMAMLSDLIRHFAATRAPAAPPSLADELRSILKDHVENETSAADLAELIYLLASRRGIYNVP